MIVNAFKELLKGRDQTFETETKTETELSRPRWKPKPKLKFLASRPAETKILASRSKSRPQLILTSRPSPNVWSQDRD